MLAKLSQNDVSDFPVRGWAAVWTTIDSSIGTRFFISYSRAEEALASALRSQLSASGQVVWRDIESIAVGDDWRAEIEHGLRACDEVVLLVSDASATSPIVAEEIQIAGILSRPVRPVVVRDLTGGVPAHIAHLNYLEFQKYPDPEMAVQIARFLEATGDCDDWKIKVVRRIHPQFVEANDAATVQTEFSTMLGPIDARRAQMDQASSIWLNHGLAACRLGFWDEGLKSLESHALASGSFAALYFCALHRLRRQRIAGLPAALVTDLEFQVRRAVAIEAHPFALVLEALLDREGQNGSITAFESAMSRALSLLPMGQERRSEALRLVWALGANLDPLGQFKRPFLTSLKEYCHG